MIPASKMAAIEEAIAERPDVVVLDLVELIAEKDKARAREGLRSIVKRLADCGLEVFVQVDPILIYADLLGSVWPGLSGVVISRAESCEVVAEADQVMTRLEAERGLTPNSLQIVLAFETAQGNQFAHNIAAVSKRTWGITLGRADLIMDLRPEPSGEIHLMQYLTQRLVTIASAVGAVPLGAWWKAPARGMFATPVDTLFAVRRGAGIGFKGTICVASDQIRAIQEGYACSREALAEARNIQEKYQLGIKSGAGIVEVDDVFVDRATADMAAHLLRMAQG